MSEQVMVDLVTALSALQPDFVVGRDYADQYSLPKDTTAVTFLWRGAGNFVSSIAQNCDRYTDKVLVIMRHELPANSSALLVQQKELTLMQNLVDFVNSNLPASIKDCNITNVSSSAQDEGELAWLIADLEVRQ